MRQYGHQELFNHQHKLNEHLQVLILLELPILYDTDHFFCLEIISSIIFQDFALSWFNSYFYSTLSWPPLSFIFLLSLQRWAFPSFFICILLILSWNPLSWNMLAKPVILTTICSAMTFKSIFASRSLPELQPIYPYVYYTTFISKPTDLQLNSPFFLPLFHTHSFKTFWYE